MATIKSTFPDSFFNDEDMVLRVSRDTKRLWAVELDLLAELKRVCEKYDIKFFAISGTLIGAARHGGFIPWDDDVDVVMMRSDYKKLETVAREEFRDPYFFQTNYTDPETLRGHAQLRNSTTTAILKSEMHDGKVLYSFNQGVFLDIFPLDKIPDNGEEREHFLAELKKVKNRLSNLRVNRMYARNWGKFPKTLGVVKRAISGWFELLWRRVAGMDILSIGYEKLDEMAQRYNNECMKYCAPITSNPVLRRHEIFEVDDFTNSVDLPFATMEIPCPKEYDKVLANAFGDWHKHVVGGAAHGGMFIDTERPYTYYLEKGCAR